jgi:hypothetical protein
VLMGDGSVMRSICTWVWALLRAFPASAPRTLVDRPTIGMYLIDRQSVCNWKEA